MSALQIQGAGLHASESHSERNGIQCWLESDMLIFFVLYLNH
jgi:hypothetical protein